MSRTLQLEKSMSKSDGRFWRLLIFVLLVAAMATATRDRDSRDLREGYNPSPMRLTRAWEFGDIPVPPPLSSLILEAGNCGWWELVSPPVRICPRIWRGTSGSQDFLVIDRGRNAEAITIPLGEVSSGYNCHVSIVATPPPPLMPDDPFI